MARARWGHPWDMVIQGNISEDMLRCVNAENGSLFPIPAAAAAAHHTPERRARDLLIA
jgi:hypothetical protein